MNCSSSCCSPNGCSGSSSGGCACSPKRSHGFATIGEVLVVAIALGGFLYLSQGTPLTVTGYITLLAITSVFYFLMLLARAIFMFMTNSDDFWWKNYETWQKIEEAEHHKHHSDDHSH